MACISHMETGSSFQIDIFPEYGTPRAFVHLEFMAMHGRAHNLFGGLYPIVLVK